MIFLWRTQKIKKNGQTQSFLESLYAAVLVFWCFTIVRWKKVVPFKALPKWCFGSLLQGLEAQIPSKHIRAPQTSMITTQIPPNTHQTSQRHPPAISREHNMPTDTARHPKTLTGAVWVCLAVSIGVCCGLFVCPVPWICLGGVFGMSNGCLGVSEW